MAFGRCSLFLVNPCKEVNPINSFRPPDTKIDLSVVAEKSDISMALIDSKGYAFWVNAAFEKHLGYSLAECQGETFSILLGPYTNNEFLIRVKSQLKTNTAFSRTELLYTKKGVSSWFKLDFSPLIDEHGQVTYSVIFTDVTEVTDLAYELTVFFNESITPKCFTDHRGVYLKVNPAFCRLVDIPEDELLGKDFRIHLKKLPPEEAKRLIKQYRSFMRRGLQQKAEYEIPVGSNRVFVEATRKKIEVHDKVYYAVFLNDITSREAYVKKIQESEMLLRAIFNSSQLSVIILDGDHRITYFNKKAELTIKRIFSRPVTLDDDILQYAAPGTEAGFIEDFERSIKGEIVDREMEIQYPTSNYNRWFRFSFIPIYNNKGQFFGVMFSSEDITERKYAELRIMEQNKKLFEISQTNSHAIRRPIASILGLINLVNHKTPEDPINGVILEKMEKAALELDEVLKNIVIRTYE
jgi:PAS domain S-box-containing protein